MEKSLLSIIIPFYKGEYFINKLLRSIESSYYLEANNIEIEVLIIVDSPQTKVDELKVLINSSVSLNFQSIINIYENEINLGVANSRNKGLACSKGSFITFIDQDDTVDLSYFEELSNYLNNFEYDMFFFNGYYIHLDSNKKVPLYFKKPTIKLRSFLSQNQIITPGLVIFNKDFLIENKFLFIDADKSFKGCDDWYLYLDIINSVNFKYVFLNKHIFNYNFHDSNYSNDIKESTLASIATINYFKGKSNDKMIKLYCNNIKRLNFEMSLYVDKLGLFNSCLKNPIGFKYYLFSHITNLNRIISFIYRKIIAMPLKMRT